MKKIIAIILVLIFTAGILISCADNSDSPISDNDGKSDADAADNQNSGETEDESEAKILPELPDTDFEGYTFTFLTSVYDSDDWRSPAPLEIVAEIETTDDPINDAVYRRNAKITEKYNFNIDMISDEDETGLLRRAIGAGDSIYDAVVMFNNNVPGIVTNGFLTNIAELPYVDLSKPW